MLKLINAQFENDENSPIRSAGQSGVVYRSRSDYSHFRSKRGQKVEKTSNLQNRAPAREHFKLSFIIN